MKKLILAGGGHGHINILKQFKDIDLNNLDITLITDFSRQYYSGMLPGFIEGIYTEEEISFDVEELCKYSNVEYIHDKILSIDANTKTVKTENGLYNFDYISMNLGASSREIFEIDDSCMAYVKPIANVVDLVRKLDSKFKEIKETQNQKLKIAIVGCGASGVEIALALSARYSELEIDIIGRRTEILDKFNPKSRLKIKNLLDSRGVKIHFNEEVISISKECVQTDKSKYFCDYYVISNGYTGLNIDFVGYDVTEENYLLVDDDLRANEFSIAMGDMICLKNYRSTPKAGVFAIRQAPILYDNLLSMLSCSGEMKSYSPQKNYLQVINTGNKKAVLNYSNYSFSGKLAWILKDYIDRAYMKK